MRAQRALTSQERVQVPPDARRVRTLERSESSDPHTQLEYDDFLELPPDAGIGLRCRLRWVRLPGSRRRDSALVAADPPARLLPLPPRFDSGQALSRPASEL